MEQKFYWACLFKIEGTKEITQYFVSSGIHPFKIALDNKSVLLNWREITEEEFSLYKQLRLEDQEYIMDLT